MFKVVMRGGEFLFDVRFRLVLLEALLDKTRDIIFSEFDKCILKSKDVWAYEDENGNMVSVSSN